MAKVKYIIKTALLIFYLLCWEIPVTFAAELPTITKSYSQQKDDKYFVYIEWDQHTKGDYGYLITKREINSGKEVTIAELLPASSGNTDVTKGGVIVDHNVKRGSKYEYKVYPYNRVSNIIKTLNNTSRLEIDKAYASEPGVSVSTQITINARGQKNNKTEPNDTVGFYFLTTLTTIVILGVLSKFYINRINKNSNNKHVQA